MLTGGVAVCIWLCPTGWVWLDCYSDNECEAVVVALQVVGLSVFWVGGGAGWLCGVVYIPARSAMQAYEPASKSE